MNKFENRNFRDQPLEVLSFGGGVQSTAMLFMIKDGILPLPDVIIHSDTGSEMDYTHEVISMAQEIAIDLNIPFIIAKSHRGKLHEYYLSKNSVPVIGVRSCTKHFKILPQRRIIRSIVGKGNGKVLARCWLGITTDEARREIKSDVQWVENRFPLLELKYSRKDCIQINKKHTKIEIKKSGCFCCPYGGKKWFIMLYQKYPELFKKCIEIEQSYQNKYGKENGLVSNLSNIKNLQIKSIFTFGGEYILPDESSCDSGGCFL